MILGFVSYVHTVVNGIKFKEEILVKLLVYMLKLLLSEFNIVFSFAHVCDNFFTEELVDQTG